MKKIISIVYLTLFLAMLIVPAIFTNTEKQAISEIDNRHLAEWPVTKSLGSDYSNGIETYLKDRIGGRSQMIHAYGVLIDRVMGELAHPTYEYGRDGYIFFRMYKNGVFNQYHKEYAEMVLQLQNYCEDRGTPFYYVFEPEKQSIYRNYLPNGFNYDDSWAREMVAYMQEIGVHVIDYTEELTKRAESEQVYNWQYDAGHWNDLGCFYATNLLFEEMHKDFEEVAPMTYDEFDVETVVAKTLTNSSFVVNEEIPKFSYIAGYDVITSDWKKEIKVNASYPGFFYFLNNGENAEELPKILIFQGSYYNRNPDFITSRAKEIIGVHNYQNVMNLDYYYTIFQPDVVIMDSAEYVISSNYFDQGAMRRMDFNPCLQVEEIDKAEMIALEETVLLDASQPHTDVLTTNIGLDDIAYVYLFHEGKVYDFKKSADEGLTVTLVKGIINNNSSIELILRDYNGKLYKMKGKCREVKNLLGSFEPTEGVTVNDYGILFTTTLPDNLFDAVNLQIYTQGAEKYLDTIYHIYGSEKAEGNYTHKMASGWYSICLKGNTNLSDEYVLTEVWLEAGKTYSFLIDVEEFSGKQIIVKDYQWNGPYYTTE